MFVIVDEEPRKMKVLSDGCNTGKLVEVQVGDCCHYGTLKKDSAERYYVFTTADPWWNMDRFSQVLSKLECIGLCNPDGDSHHKME